MKRIFFLLSCLANRSLTGHGPGLQSNTWFPGPTGVNIPSAITIGSAVFTGLTIVTDRPTDRPRYSVYVVRSTAMRPK